MSGLLIPLLLWFIASSKTKALSFASVRSAVGHLQASLPEDTAQSRLSNTRIPRRDGKEVLAYCAEPNASSSLDGRGDVPVLVLLHEFFGLSRSICDKAHSLSHDLDCLVVAPDLFRGESSRFIPKCIWLALSTPTDRIYRDLDDVMQWVSGRDDVDPSNVAVMGFCFGGGKAIRYTAEHKPDAATVVCYGSPLTDVAALSKLQKPVCGVFGSNDVQFPMPLLDKFRGALHDAHVENDIRVYDGVGHAFWSDMDQVRRGDHPQADAYEQVTTFLRKQFDVDT